MKQSCDIILCSGTSPMSKKIRWFNKITGVKGPAADLSHVALYLRGFTGFVFESTTLNKWADKSGVQRNYFDVWLRHYKGRVWIRRFDFARDKDFEQKFYAFTEDHLGDPYESGIAGYGELLLAGLRLDRVVRKVWKTYRPVGTKTLHCSEIDVMALQHMGLCSEKAIPSRLPPSCFWEGGALEQYLDVHLGHAERLK